MFEQNSIISWTKFIIYYWLKLNNEGGHLNNVVVMAIGQLSVMSTIFWRIPAQPREKPSVRDPAKAIKYDVHCFWCDVM